MVNDIEKKENILNLLGYLLISLISCILTCFVYKICYGKFTYNNLTDFYVGNSIYSNINKTFDLWIFAVYLIIFFVILVIYRKIVRFLPHFCLKFAIPDFNLDFTNFLNNHKVQVFVIEVLTSFLYVFLHPLNGHFYWQVAILILFFVSFSIWHSYKNLYKIENPKLSIFALVPIFILLFGQGYNTGYNGGIDNHHSGEQIAVFFQHQYFGLNYYKDIMLVHGGVDVVPTFLGSVMFGENTLYSALLGRSLFDNLIVVLTVIFSYYVFVKCPVFLSFSMFRAYNIPQLYVLTFLLMLKKMLLNKPYVWLSCYILLSFTLLFFWTTYGTFWFMATMPLAGYVLFKFSKTDKMVLKFISLIFLVALIIFLNKDIIYNYILQAPNYIQSNLYAFGNGFPKIKLHQIFSDLIKLFALFITPYFIVKLIDELKKSQKNIVYLFTLVFSIIFVCTSLNYTLGRIDFIAMQRIKDISMSYLGIIIPYLLLQKNSRYLLFFKYIAVFFFVIITFLSLPNLKRWLPENHLEKCAISEKIGEFSFSKEFETNLTEIKNVLEKYSKSENDFLDLNYGMNYFYFNKKLQIPFVSYYNIVNSRQNKACAEILNKNMPNVILISTVFQNYFDNIYPSLRINAIYREILLNRKYNLLQTETNTFLVKSENAKFLKKDLQILDKKFSSSDLGYLPESWGNSINNLPLKSIEISNKIKYEKNKIIITFDVSQKGENIDLIGLITSKKHQSYRMKINGSSSILTFKSKNGKLLIPFDNFPSWLLNDNIKQIEIETEEQVKLMSLNFYKRDI